MTEKLKQSLSAAIDDEADAFELRRVLDELGRDTELRSLWDRYHLIGSVLRGDRQPVPVILRERVWQALETDGGEVDGGEVNEDVAPSADVPPAASRPAVNAKAGPRLGRYTGLAVAASVAFAVVLGFSSMWDDEVSTGTGIASNDPTPMVAGPDDVLWQSDVSGIQADRQVSDTDVQRAQAYILHHTQQQAINQAGVMSFVKLATYEAP